MKIHFAFFGIVSSFILGGMFYYLASWTGRFFPRIPISPLLLRLLFLLTAAAVMAIFIYFRRSDGGLSSALVYASYLMMGSAFIWFWTALAGDILFIAGRMFVDAAYWRHIIGVGIASVTAAACIGAFVQAQRTPRLHEITIPFKNLPENLDGFTIAQMTDMHIGATVTKGQLLRAEKVIMGLHPDIFVVTGDIKDPGLQDPSDLLRVLKNLPNRYGKFAVLGNHEYYHNYEASLQLLAEAGIPLLRQSAVTLPNGIQVAGIDDIRTAGITDAQITGLLSGLNRDMPVIYLSHQPERFELAADNGAWLMLSGHTHAGQIFPFNIFVHMFHKRVVGLFTHKNSFLYISPGTFYWGPPMRLFTRSEITLLTLKKAAV